MGTFADVLRARADDDHPGVLFEDESYTWREVVAASAARAALGRGLRTDGPFHIGIMLENVPEFVFWIGAAALSGGVAVGVNTTRRGAELVRDIQHTDCQLLVTDSTQLPLLDGHDCGIPADRILVVDSPQYAALLAVHEGAGLDQADLHEADPLLLLFTSGSTGAPKAVICTTGRLARIAEHSAPLFGITADEVCYESMPMFHGNAIMANLAPAVAAGATFVLRRKFSASGFLSDVRRYGATYFNYVGRALAYILATPPTPEDADNRLRLGFGTEATAQDRERFTQRFGCRLIESYGSSEGPIAMSVVPGTPPNALGRPQEGMDVAIVDPETGVECARAVFDANGVLANSGEAIGEIVNRAGAAAFEGYYNNPDAEAERIRNGWYWSGDLGYRDEQGFFYFAGRGADWLRVDSENFAGAPIERILQRHPAVAVAAVYPVPDPHTGDQVMAAVELVEGTELTPAGLDEFLAAQSDLGTKWAPRFVRVVPQMPVTASTKVAKASLRKQRWETDDLVYWRPSRGEGYRPLTPQDAAALREEFARNGREAVLATV